MLEKIKGTVEFIQSKYSKRPQIGIILGTGLGALVDDIDVEEVIEYEKIPNFPVSTVESHHGRLIFGKISGKTVVVMQGRFHYYEGYSAQEITFPIRVFKFLGIEKLLISNASGGLNPDHAVSDLMIMTDHINLHPGNPLRGKNNAGLGPRFPDMSEPYDHKMIDQALKIAEQHRIKVHKGVYASVTGPNLETPAEYKFMRIIGADAVGMSTVPECIVARQMDIPVFAISIITDLGVPGKIEKISVEDVIMAANSAEPKMTLIFKELIALQ
ncbi:MAG TPA: purine-nucleoside phosphorylase [Cytophagales bacterium]|jgi:purine-nucleoside phosphorylase|nr:purine-nucleoside phosphorylase [Cytophagales bacterium]